ncbi:hypothetical protein [Pararhodospirillum oryzae]|uniref:DUF2846 domain-containing protein n=1 Tax=Pararhodospirillum oryzae TaxID=478448 RepID=A0A512HBY9_9PROT|nr:hypothetical protein [Pararhodospirillum oryzae]GEO82967.1 hypothetical protein ROR02_30980 [Pararhodospirillum oryzae]
MRLTRPFSLVAVSCALLILAACGGPQGRSLSAEEGVGAAQGADSATRSRTEAVGLAQSGMPRDRMALAYVYQEPGTPLIDETVTMDGGTPVPLRVNQYLVWELEPGPHLVEAWRGTRRLGSRALTLRPEDVTYLKFAVKNNLGGLLYLVPAGAQEGEIFVRSTNFGR